ncbi:MAG: hypothetical protein UT63_C0083G0007 [Candidatus Gottesmanbacteria bacterium GW2011_GWC2_39_8]|uniref:Bacillopeptidase F n=1 Tax=Candidatus Gottesmanbacteria bacterium GW2011_GWC2_39_8 TaxID=1618450 RepID=A0A0G0SZW8_9BACT|nr:MAG: hypothetical protein UT63_C0083G0007 [Candidatus Gottesmanbacteria bacterium GW2011_GWC2_39_8]
MKKIFPLLFIAALFMIGMILFGLKKSGEISYKPDPSEQNSVNVPDVQNQNPTISSDNVVNTLSLEITSPNDRSTVNSSKITIEGKTSPNADISVNEVDTKADSNGLFKATINLDEGENAVVVYATDEQGNFAEKEIIILYNWQ